MIKASTSELERREKNARENLEKHTDLLRKLAEITWSDKTEEYEKKIASQVHEEMIMGKRAGGMSRSEAKIIETALRAIGSPQTKFIGEIGEEYKSIPVIYEGGPVFRQNGESKRMARFRVSDGPFLGGLLVWNAYKDITQKKGDLRTPIRIGAPYFITFRVRGHKVYNKINQTFIGEVRID